eukprot:TRINITY_DN13127_c0_g1_i1.p1 TRINITY_DN13127_c0_g1~~TRINITY_DN13127_c0_g1_i1.p1  ORF type:complete len:250 (-),score=63.37 TRINITY_DN13127_c0_g1_i1:38-787(-)
MQALVQEDKLQRFIQARKQAFRMKQCQALLFKFEDTAKEAVTKIKAMFESIAELGGFTPPASVQLDDFLLKLRRKIDGDIGDQIREPLKEVADILFSDCSLLSLMQIPDSIEYVAMREFVRGVCAEIGVSLPLCSLITGRDLLIGDILREMADGYVNDMLDVYTAEVSRQHLEAIRKLSLLFPEWTEARLVYVKPAKTVMVAFVDSWGMDVVQKRFECFLPADALVTDDDWLTILSQYHSRCKQPVEVL